MLLVLFSWIYVLAATTIFGFAFNKWARTGLRNLVTIVFLGMAGITVFTSVWAFFGRINIEFHAALWAVNAAIALAYKNEFLLLLKHFFSSLAGLPRAIKVFLPIIALLLLWHTSTAPAYIDNETYYIQTIKWLNTCGFVKGIANLHIFLGQTSGWHIAQSVFSLSFLYDHFNDLNGLWLLLANVFAALKSREASARPLCYGFLTIGNIMLFPFAAVPSPDLPVCVFAFVMLVYFITDFERCSTARLNLLFVLGAFTVLIKVTAFALLLFPIIWLGLNPDLAKRIGTAGIWCALLLVVFIAKNTILTGYPFFPAPLFNQLPQLDYALPEPVYDFWFNAAKRFDFMLTASEYGRLSGFDIFSRWLFNSGFDSVINCIIAGLVCFSPWLIYRRYNRRAYWIAYAIMLLQAIFVVPVSPQYRFMLPFVLLFGALWAAGLVPEKFRIAVLYASFPVMVLMLVFPLSHSSPIAFRKPEFNANLFIFPEPNSALKTQYSRHKFGSLSYVSPDKRSYIWATGNGSLPCVSNVQLSYLAKKTGYVAQQRSGNIPGGFRSVRVKDPGLVISQMRRSRTAHNRILQDLRGQTP